jgi:hypothetical protein
MWMMWWYEARKEETISKIFGKLSPTFSSATWSWTGEVCLRPLGILLGPRLPLRLGSEVDSLTFGATCCPKSIRKFKDMYNIEVYRYL